MYIFGKVSLIEVRHIYYECRLPAGSIVLNTRCVTWGVEFPSAACSSFPHQQETHILDRSELIALVWLRVGSIYCESAGCQGPTGSFKQPGDWCVCLRVCVCVCVCVCLFCEIYTYGPACLHVTLIHVLYDTIMAATRLNYHTSIINTSYIIWYYD